MTLLGSSKCIKWHQRAHSKCKFWGKPEPQTTLISKCILQFRTSVKECNSTPTITATYDLYEHQSLFIHILCHFIYFKHIKHNKDYYISSSCPKTYQVLPKKHLLILFYHFLRFLYWKHHHYHSTIYFLSLSAIFLHYQPPWYFPKAFFPWT